MSARAAAVNDGAEIAIKETDADVARRAKLPPATELFPGMRQSVREFYMFQISMHSISHFHQQIGWWNDAMEVSDRARLCRLAKLDVKLAEKSFLEISTDDRARLIARFIVWREWVNGFHPPLHPYILPAFDPDPVSS